MNESAGSPARNEPETLALRRLQTAAADAELALGKRLGLGPNDLAALGHITFAADPIGPSELAARLGLSPAASTELIDRLEKVGHLERNRDTADRRRIRLTATESARAEVLAALAPLLSGLDEAVAAYSADEREVIRRFLAEATTRYAAFLP